MLGKIEEFKDTVFSKKISLNLRGKLISLDAPAVMGVLNITPDSFYAESRTGKYLIKKAGKMLEDGALLLDIGGYSSRPGASDITEEEELARVIPSIKALVKEFSEVLISVDTFRSEVARIAVDEGACMINDISGGELDNKMFQVVAKAGVPYVLMHMKGNPQSMTGQANYSNVSLEVLNYFIRKLGVLKNLGVKDLIIDPGFGFAKTISHNFTLLKEMSVLNSLGLPILAGLSRKSMIYKTLGIEASEALPGTIALNMIALQNGANILRVHDVKEAVQITKLYKALYF